MSWKKDPFFLFIIVFLIILIIMLVILGITAFVILYTNIKYNNYYVGVKQEDSKLVIVAMDADTLSCCGKNGTSVLVLDNMTLSDIDRVMHSLKINGKKVINYEPLVIDKEPFAGVDSGSYDIVFYVRTRR